MMIASRGTDRWTGAAGRRSMVVAGMVALLGGCAIEQNDRIEVGGRVPPPLAPQEMTLGRAGDAPSVTSLDRSGWGASEFEVPSDMIVHRPTYARRLNDFEVSSRASGRFPTLAEAITLPGGPSESEQIYDAITWSFMIYPGVVAVPLGIFVERPLQEFHRSPGWRYERHAQGQTPGQVEGLTGDPLVDRLGLPVEGVRPTVRAPASRTGRASPAGVAPADSGSSGATGAPADGTPMFEIRPLTDPATLPPPESSSGGGPR